MRLSHPLSVVALLVSSALPFAAQATTQTSHAISLHSTAKYPANFSHFAYTNPQAVKGGDIRQWSMGTFDSLNPFISKGTPADGISLIYDALTERSLDEPSTAYGLLANKIERDPNDNSWVIYHLNPKAHFSDGKAVTAQDVVFTFNIIRRDGDPMYKAYYADIQAIEAIDKQRVKFSFKTKNNPELPYIVGELPILPRHYWEKRNFSSSGLDIPVGSGAYTISKIDAGRSITYKRNPNYWARDLNVNRGRHNFNTITYLYFRDSVVATEAFKAGQYDFRVETKAKSWATEYNFPAARQGLVKRIEQKHQNPTGMQAFVFNTRRAQFKDVRVREALSHAFDFEWSNKALFNNAYVRTSSFYSNSDLASSGLPSPAELKILSPYKEKIAPSVFVKPYQPPKTDGSGNNRSNLLKAQALLKEAGWDIKGGKLIDKNNKPFSFEILLVQPEFERVVQPFRQNLTRLGIDMRIRTVDVPQYINRTRSFDFDMIVDSFPQSLSPGNEQRDFWSSKAADQSGSRNSAGVKDPVVDALVEQLIRSKDRATLINHTRALDRVLLSGHYVIPQFHIRTYRLAFWDIFERPKTAPAHGVGFDTWWVNPEKLKRVRDTQGKNRK